jgi:tetratricopeptide (TPR) repeat protein
LVRTEQAKRDLAFRIFRSLLPQALAPYFGSRSLAGAIDDFDQAIKLDPALSVAWHGRGTARAMQNDLEDALLDLNRAVRLAPRSAGSYMTRGEVHFALADVISALRDYDRAAALAPETAPIQTARAWAYARFGDLDEAIKGFEAALRLNPRDLGAVVGLAITTRRRQESQELPAPSGDREL